MLMDADVSRIVAMELACATARTGITGASMLALMKFASDAARLGWTGLELGSFV